MNPTSPSQRALNAANAIFQVRADGLISIPESLQKLTSRAEVLQAVALLIDEHCPPQEPEYGIWTWLENDAGFWDSDDNGSIYHGSRAVMLAQSSRYTPVSNVAYLVLPFGPNGQPVFPDAPMTREDEVEECLNRR